MRRLCKHASEFFWLLILLISMTSCASFSFAPPDTTPPEEPTSAKELEENRAQIIRQIEETLLRAEAHVRAARMRLEEKRPFEARNEFERARLLLTQEIDPKLNYLNQTTGQAGVGILSAQLPGIMVRRRELGRSITEMASVNAQTSQQQRTEKIDELRRQSETALQPIVPPTPYYSETNPSRPGVQQPQVQETTKWRNVEEAITRNIGILLQQGEAFQQCLLRANRYFPQVTSILASEGVPEVLAYVALLESGYQPKAKSSSGNAGLWQISPSIARKYGLRVDAQCDERLLVHASTRAFARYVSQRYQQYGNWVQVIAGLSSDQDYLARFIAANRIANDPRQYGFYGELPNLTGRYNLLDEVNRVHTYAEPDIWQLPEY